MYPTTSKQFTYCRYGVQIVSAEIASVQMVSVQIVRVQTVSVHIVSVQIVGVQNDQSTNHNYFPSLTPNLSKSNVNESRRISK